MPYELNLSDDQVRAGLQVTEARPAASDFSFDFLPINKP
jgi:hypothetical protein